MSKSGSEPGSELFEDVLEDDHGGRAVDARQRVGGSELRADEFAALRGAIGPDGEPDSRFRLLQLEEQALRAQEPRGGGRRVRWTGALWLLAAATLLAAAAGAWLLSQRAKGHAEQTAMERANADRRKAEEERLLQMGKVQKARGAENPAPR